MKGDAYFVFFSKQETAYERRISDWSSDVCSSDLTAIACSGDSATNANWRTTSSRLGTKTSPAHADSPESAAVVAASASSIGPLPRSIRASIAARSSARSEEHTSELQSLMRISYAVFCLKKKKNKHNIQKPTT